MSLLSALLYVEFSNRTFCDFHIKNPDQLEIRPYHGALLPCNHIIIGGSECGTSLKSEKTITINDVREHNN